jgi:hypothetical protein
MPMTRKITEIAIADIRIPEGRRALDLAKVKEIAASITLLGMLSPIGVRRHGDAPVELVWGGHRLAAKKGLGHKTIAAIAVDGLGWDRGHRETADLDDYVKMTEIAENLFRADLTVQERNEQLAEWVVLFEKIPQPISDAETPIATRPGRKPSPAIAKVAKMSGLTAKTVKQAIKSTKVSPEVKAAADDAGLTSKQRLAISRLPEADQIEGVSKQAAINIVADRTEQTAAAKMPKPPQLAIVPSDPAAKLPIDNPSTLMGLLAWFERMRAPIDLETDIGGMSGPDRIDLEAQIMRTQGWFGQIAKIKAGQAVATSRKSPA